MSRYIRTLIILLAAVQTVGTMKAEDETSGTGGTTSTGPTVRGNVFGGGNLAKVEGSVTVNVRAGTVANDVYGGGAKAETNTAITGNPVTAVNLIGGIVTGSVYGGGLGQQEVAAQAAVGDPGDADYKPAVAAQTAIDANVNGTVTVTVSGGTANNVYGCNNLQGAPQKDVTVNIQGGTINNNVFGGGNQADAPGSIVVNVTGGTVKKDVYGGGALASTNTGNTANTTDFTTNVFLFGGTIEHNVYGGGLGEKSGVGGATADNPAYVNGNVKVYLNGLETADYVAASHSTLAPIDTDGDSNTNYYQVGDDGCKVKGNIFGCNNLCGTPRGKVKVHVFKTFGYDDTHTKSTGKTNTTYDVAAVYGGGDMAAYEPTAATSADETVKASAYAEVVIDGCDYTSIQQVYGGGNAASTPATNVVIYETYEIGEVFGGGNGAGTVYINSADHPNPGANVGFHEYGAKWVTPDSNKPFDTKENRITHYAYGSGKAQVDIHGGTIHAVFGGSNTKGNVREVAVAMLEEDKKNTSTPTPICAFKVNEAYGGSKSAPMDGKAILDLGCIPGIDEVYGGSKDADVNDDVVLTITNGTYNRVFGGNNDGHTINGSIKVNIEETGCSPIIIGQVFAGGNKAVYSTPEGKEEPAVNIKSFTSIGQVFGGGFGATAVLTGNPTININEVKGNQAAEYAGETFTFNAGQPDKYTVALPAHTADKIGTIGDVFGGGYGADVIGNVTVNIGTEDKIDYTSMAEGETTPKKQIEVVGADIARSVYGGGYGASTNVTGDVVVNVGHTGASDAMKANITIGGNVYGGSALGKVNKPTTGETTDKTTKVNLYAGRITQHVYGGGMGEAPTAAVGETPASPGTKAEVWGDTEVTVYGDMITGAVYGGCNLHGEMKKNATVTVLGGKIGEEFDGTTAHPVPATIPNVLFGGGKGANTSVVGITTVNIGTDPSVQTTTYAGTANIYGNVYGGSENGSVGVVNVNLYANTIWGDVFGGGYSTAANATAATDVNVTLEGTAFGILTVKDDTNKDVPVTGRVFGCNNLVGSPTGDVVVNVNKTARRDGGAHAKTTETAYNYEVQAVYGGGNQAAYAPTASGAKSQVNISGCDETSIEYVYGGGNAAPMNTATNVKVEGAFEIGYTFGGGNGSDRIKSGTSSTGWTENPGANVTGNANSVLIGGFIHNVFGGSNTKGTISGATSIDISESQSSCDLITENVYGAGKSADVNGDIDIRIGCLAANVKNVYGGAMAAKISGNVTLTVTSGILENVYGGNNESGGIGGKITVNIEEVDECNPIVIGNLYGGGNLAPYPGDLASLNANPNIEVNVKSFTSIGNIYGGGRGADAVVTGNTVVNINEVLGRHAAKARGAQTLTINEKPVTIPAHAANEIGAIGNVYGGGDEASVHGNTTINIANLENVEMKYVDDVAATTDIDEKHPAVLGAKITGNVYGGGNLANVGKYHEDQDANGKTIDVIDVKGNTFVNIGAKYDETTEKYVAVAEGSAKVTIGGNVFGGGKGEAADPGTSTLAGAFRCGKAMVTGGTNVAIGNGTVSGTVYGGGEKGRVEENTVVTIGLGDGAAEGQTPTSAPVVSGNVFGAGAGVNTHGYSALVRGNSYVTVQADAKVKKCVYGGGEIASVGKYNIDANGMPQSLANEGSGYCTVVIQGNAVIGPDEAMAMTSDGGPDDYGHVFGAGMGVLPYEGYGDNDKAWRTTPDNTKQEYLSKTQANGGADESVYLKYVETLGLATQTYVTIDGNAFVKGSVYGGSMNGYVQHDTQVNIRGNCQIGNGYVQMTDDGTYLTKTKRGGVNRRYTEQEWNDGHLHPTDELAALVGTNYTASLPECASWEYGQATGDNKYAPWDKYAGTEGYDSKGGRTTADDGHTFYGNVFGGGSGVLPYRPGKWHPEAGSVGGDTQVNITGGHILTSVYGGNELTDVYGTCTVNFGGTATLGVPRTLKQIDAHPLTCYLFGAGKGDQRSLFNKSTNVKEVVVNITGGRIYGSVFGGGEDGHVHRNVTMTIGDDNGNGPTIGTWGTSYVDGNVFGGGRGFGGDAYTAGNVAGSVKMEIKGGTMLGSIYGGGRLGSVGYGLFDSSDSNYGEMRPDKEGEAGNPVTDFNLGRGHIDITISGGTIGNDHEYVVPTGFSNWTDANWATWKAEHHISKTEFDTATGRLTHTKGGNVFAGGMGRFYQLDGTTPISVIDWWKLGSVKSTKLRITGGNIKSNVYGGGEQGWTSGYHTTDGKNLSTEISISGGTIGTEVKDGGITKYTFGSVFGGGYGSSLEKLVDANQRETNPKFQAGRVKHSTKVDISGGTVLASVYGGGEVASVGYGFYSYHDDNVIVETPLTNASEAANTYVNISGNAVIGKDKEGDTYFGGATMGNVYGGGSGNRTIVRCGLILGNTNVNVTGGTIYHNIYGGGAYGSVGDFEYETQVDPDHQTKKVYGVEKLHTSGTGTANITITGGTIGIDGRENGMVFGSSRGDVQGNMQRDDYMAWVNDTRIVIGASGATADPLIRGTVYGSGENGHTFNNTQIDLYSGTVGITEGSPLTSGGVTYNGAAYPYRGNIYGGGCGTDMYDSDNDGVEDRYNPLAGVVYGNTTVNIHGGQVAHNVYGAGAMGSVGKKDATTGAITSGGTTTITVSGGTVGVSGALDDGNVFGAARGDAVSTQDGLAQVKVTNVTISGGEVKGNVYGGGEAGDVGTYTSDDGGSSNTYAEGSGICNVTVTGGTIGSAQHEGHVFGAGKGVANTFTCQKAMVRETHVSIDKGTIYGNVYGGGEVGRVEYDTEVKIGPDSGTDTPQIMNSVYGGGAGVKTHGYSALVRGNTNVTVQGSAKVGHSVYGGGEIASVGRYGLNAQKMPNILVGGGVSTVSVKGNATIGANVFGAGKGVEAHFVQGQSKRMTLNDNNEIVWESFQDEASYASYLETLALVTQPHVTIMETATVGGSVFGGGELGITKGSVTVNIEGGTVTKDVYGGGALANTNTTHDVAENWPTEKPTKNGDGSIVTKTVYPTTMVNLTGGTIGSAYGGGLGRLASDGLTAVAATVGGDVTVTLNGSKVNGNIFGANNINGTPLGHVLVHVKRTIRRDGHDYHVDAVFGGGNNADYVPTDTKQYSEVIIEGCDVTCIEKVFGGGNAANTPGTEVLIKGDSLINEVFGGGNGRSTATFTNPGANVGYYHGGAIYAKGEGNAVVKLMAGRVNYVYGGSDSKGDIRGTSQPTSVTNTHEEGCCPNLTVKQIYGGGKDAEMQGGAEIVLSCMPDDWIEEVYAGARNADVGNDVSLTITSGRFGRVFGGNKDGGKLKGSITVNIEENGACGSPIIIGELYGGGDNAPYSMYGYTDNADGSVSPVESGSAPAYANYHHPVVNVRSFTSIGNIFGGGKGQKAVMVASPTVNINEVLVGEGNVAYDVKKDRQLGKSVPEFIVAPDEEAFGKVVLYPHEAGKIGVIGTVYGGGSEAKVIGDTNVNIGTTTTEPFVNIGDNKNPVLDANGGYTFVTKRVVGADIRGNVYGGGNQAEVTGDTHVVIGKEATTAP